MPRSPITTHVLDLATGSPAAGITVLLEKNDQGEWRQIAHGTTNSDGRVSDLLPEDAQLEPGMYRLTFETASYHKGNGFYPYVPVVFEIANPAQHYHVPLLLSPFGYSTYRGS